MMDEIDDREAAEQIAARAAVSAAAERRRQRIVGTPAAAAAAEGRRQRVEVISVLKQHDELHLRTRNKIDELVEEFLNIHGMVWNADDADGDDGDDDADDADDVDDVDDVDDDAECRRQRVELISILEQHDTLISLLARNKIDEWVAEFLTRTKDDIHDMLCDNQDEAPDGDEINDDDDEDDDENHYYRGLDSDRDTEAEVETALRFFPEVLSRRGGAFNIYPIQYLLTGYSTGKAVPFIPLLARLAIEFGLFEKKERGGLLFETEEGDNILQLLVSDILCQHHVDDKYLNVMIQLRQMGYLNKDDIQKYGLVVNLRRCHYISENMLRFLVGWDPTSLIKTEERTGNLPLHVASISRHDFRMVFEYGIRYYPRKKGISLLFKIGYRNVFGPTPFQKACKKFGYEEVMKAVEEILIRYSDTPINITEALITAAIDEDIHLDCVYFLLRREPDILLKLLSSRQATVTAMTIDGSTNEATSNNCDSEKLKRKRGI